VSKCPANKITNPNPVCSHCVTWLMLRLVQNQIMMDYWVCMVRDRFRSCGYVKGTLWLINCRYFIPISKWRPPMPSSYSQVWAVWNIWLKVLNPKSPWRPGLSCHKPVIFCKIWYFHGGKNEGPVVWDMTPCGYYETGVSEEYIASIFRVKRP
jgi:hypothetical protein